MIFDLLTSLQGARGRGQNFFDFACPIHVSELTHTPNLVEFRLMVKEIA